MATLTIRNLDDELKSRLRIRAARHDTRWKRKRDRSSGMSYLTPGMSRRPQALKHASANPWKVSEASIFDYPSELRTPESLRTSDDRPGYERALRDHEAGSWSSGMTWQSIHWINLLTSIEYTVAPVGFLNRETVEILDTTPAVH